ncbi:extracellular solute-binding protein [Vallitalea pronyensis]|uniref:Extracellular solute-binding protein n=1 Tax=Vallitalea pronyensis TaxID=1348613 RepID=A0A8J8MIY3_9FIRM|nr:extracellular solute-binding protein [Vallitalea pronyensis]QUI22306.1 extracellular solute-binding protein [Vallitalea pronyensis]
MKKKQWVTVLLILAVSMMTILSGCSSNKDNDKKKTAKEVNTQVDDSGKVNGLMYKEGLPIVDPGDYSFSIFTDGDKTTDDFYLMPVLKEQTGIDVDVQLFSYEVAKERYSLALNSGDYADCIGGWVLSSTDILKFGVDMGTFIPLEDYFEAFAPNISAVLELEGVREKMTAPDGHIYSIPYVLAAPEVDFNPYINTRWLENLGLEVPQTTEDLKKVLTAFKEKDANGNGDTDDEIPFSFSPDNKNIGYMAGYFGMSLNEYGFTMVGDELVFGANQEPYKDIIMYMSDLYKNGLLDQEMFTQDAAQWKAKGGQDLYGVCMMYGSGDIMPYEAGETPDWIPLPVLSSEKCDEPVWFRDTYGTTVLKNQVVVTDNAKNPEAIVRWWDNLFELENSIQTNGGPLGIALHKKDNGYEINQTNMTQEEKDTYSWINLFPQSLPRYIPTDFKFLENPPSYPEKDKVDEAYAPYLLEKIIPPYWATLEESSSLSELQTSITDYITEKTAEWIAGQADVEAEWDSYLKQLNKLKLDDYIQIRQNAIKASKN